MNPPVSRHPVTITNRVLFSGPQLSQGPPPLITARMQFSTHHDIHAVTVDAPSTPPMDISTESGAVAADNNDSGGRTSGTSDTDDETDKLLEYNNKKIPKPAGEPARPGSGGYRLEAVLQGWTPDFFNAVNVSNPSF